MRHTTILATARALGEDQPVSSKLGSNGGAEVAKFHLITIIRLELLSARAVHKNSS
jgi:hypothetical protein